MPARRPRPALIFAAALTLIASVLLAVTLPLRSAQAGALTPAITPPGAT